MDDFERVEWCEQCHDCWGMSPWCAGDHLLRTMALAPVGRVRIVFTEQNTFSRIGKLTAILRPGEWLFVKEAPSE